jgi:GTPase SAR1 family protein
MALQITTFSNKDQKIKAVIFGDSGTGKTSFAGTAARKYKTLFISAEG